MAETAKCSIIDRAVQEGHTDSYGALLYMVAVVGTDPSALEPKSEKEHTAWTYYWDGLRAALLCLTMYELKVGPELAARAVDGHIKNAMIRLDRRGGIGTGE